MKILFRHKPGYLGKSRTSNSYSTGTSRVYDEAYGFACCNEINSFGSNVRNAFSKNSGSQTISCRSLLDIGFSRFSR